MAQKFKWPTDPPGKAPSHSISWQQHQSNGSGGGGFSNGTPEGTTYLNGKPLTEDQWRNGDYLNTLLGRPAGTPYDPATGGTGPAVTPQPFDPLLESQKLGATWNNQLAGSEAGYQKGETAWSSGYNADGSLNTSNPYSQAMLLQDSYKRGVTDTNNSMAASGQLYSGARLNAQGHNDRVYAEGSSALKDQARQTYHGIDYGQLQTFGQNALGTNDADYQALRRSVYGS